MFNLCYFVNFYKIFKARDVDKTSEIKYSIIDGNVNNLFSIDGDMGEIFVTNKSGLDMTGVNSNVINLTVQVSQISHQNAINAIRSVLESFPS